MNNNHLLYLDPSSCLIPNHLQELMLKIRPLLTVGVPSPPLGPYMKEKGHRVKSGSIIVF